MFAKFVSMLETVHASNRVAIALKNGGIPLRRDLRLLGVREDRIRADFS